MASHAALAASMIPSSTRVPSRASHSPCFSKKLNMGEISGLRSSSCVTFAEAQLLTAQLAPERIEANPVREETVAKLKVAINDSVGLEGTSSAAGMGGTRKDSPLEVIVVNYSGGVKNGSHLLKYDSMLRTCKADVKIVDNETIRLTAS